MTLPLEQMLTAIACILSACDSGHNGMSPLAVQKNDIACQGEYDNVVGTMLRDLTELQNNQKQINERFTAQLDKIVDLTKPQLREKRSLKFALPQDCQDQPEGVVSVKINHALAAFDANCENNEWGAGWIVVANRYNGSVSFDRNVTMYRDGFAYPDGEFFIGFERLHAITQQRLQELLIVKVDELGAEQYERYKAFGIEKEGGQYLLKSLGMYSGNGVDSLRARVGLQASFDHISYTAELKILVRPRIFA